jgi:hypothetical protein
MEREDAQRQAREAEQRRSRELDRQTAGHMARMLERASFIISPDAPFRYRAIAVLLAAVFFAILFFWIIPQVFGGGVAPSAGGEAPR